VQVRTSGSLPGSYTENYYYYTASTEKLVRLMYTAIRYQVLSIGNATKCISVTTNSEKISCKIMY